MTLRVVFMGTPEFAVAALTKVRAAHEIIAVYSQPPRAAGRGLAERPSPVQQYAEKHGLAVFTPVSLKTSEEQDRFRGLNADIAVVAAYGLILPRPILEMPRLGCVNIHASLLPRWRGAAPIQRAIMAGDAESGVTIMQMDVGLDTGPMLLSRATPITPATTAADLHDTLAVLGSDLIVEALTGLEQGRLPARPQPSEGITHAAKIAKSEAHLDFARPAAEVLRRIHGLSPFPGAWFGHGEERIKVLRAELAEGHGLPGTLLDDRLAVACGEGAVRLLDVQRAGRGPMAAEQFLRGYGLPKGARLA